MALSTSEIKIKNTINMYDTLTSGQLEVLCNLKSSTQINTIKALVRKKAIKKECLPGGPKVYCNYFSNPNRKFVLINEVLKQVISESGLSILWFQKQNYPFEAMAFMQDKIFDIAVIEEGEEIIFNSVMNRVYMNETGLEKDDYISAPAPRENILIIVESTDQIDILDIKYNNIVFACVDIGNNLIKFMSKD